MKKKQKIMIVRIIITVVLLIALHFVPLDGKIMFLLYLIPYLVIGYDILLKAVKGILKGQVFDENFLMAVATVGAFVLGVLYTGDYLEAVAVMLFYQIGELFQSIAVGRSRKNISELMDIRPDYANIEVDGKLVKTDPDEIAVGSLIVVLPGEKVAIDGVVEDGESSVNTAALTGESVPGTVRTGDEVLSGSINMSGRITLRTTKEFGESTASKILDLVENASSYKSRSENFISKFARVYTPAVCIAAIVLALVPPVFIMIFLGGDPMWAEWIYRALTFLVISCPCALVISIPLSFFAGLGGASASGVLIKGSNYLEALSKTAVTVFDKTGTLTQGVFEVVAVHHSTMASEELLYHAAIAESSSNHPIALSIINAYGKRIDSAEISDVREVSGQGVVVKAKGREIACGNDKLMRSLKVDFHDCHKTGTIVHVAIDGEYSGHIVISDVVKKNSSAAIAALKAIGIKKTVMLTGDRKAVAEQTAVDLGIDTVYSELLPEDKVNRVIELMQGSSENEKLAFVGDGINDAPVLSCADIGIAMGALGSDAAIEAADVVLMDDDPLKLKKAILIARKCMRIVYENIVFAIGVKALCLILGALGFANMWLAIFADVGVMVLAVLNAIRALFVKKL